MKVKYLTAIPENVRVRKNTPIQNILDEFMKTDFPVMQVSINAYKNINTARTTWYRAIKRSNYSLRIAIPKEKNALYVAKVSPDELT